MYNRGEKTSSSQKRKSASGMRTVLNKEGSLFVSPPHGLPRRQDASPSLQHVILLFFFLTLILTMVNCENSEGASPVEELMFLMVLMSPDVGAILETLSLWRKPWSRLSVARHPCQMDQAPLAAHPHDVPVPDQPPAPCRGTRASGGWKGALVTRPPSAFPRQPLGGSKGLSFLAWLLRPRPCARAREAVLGRLRPDWRAPPSPAWLNSTKSCVTRWGACRQRAA